MSIGTRSSTLSFPQHLPRSLILALAGGAAALAIAAAAISQAPSLGGSRAAPAPAATRTIGPAHAEQGTYTVYLVPSEAERQRVLLAEDEAARIFALETGVPSPHEVSVFVVPEGDAAQAMRDILDVQVIRLASGLPFAIQDLR